MTSSVGVPSRGASVAKNLFRQDRLVSEALLMGAATTRPPREHWHMLPAIRQTREIPDEGIPVLALLPEFRRLAAMPRKIGRPACVHEKAVRP
jgi:hypothetical protein